MTIRKGEQWGSADCLPRDHEVVREDRGLALSARPVCVLTGGNLHRALGLPPARTAGDECTLLPVDALAVDVTGTDGHVKSFLAASDVVVGRWFSPGDFVVLTNSGHLGNLHVAPRAHPNDGQFDIMSIDASMNLRHRLAAHRRARSGTHIPHPAVTVRRSTSTTIRRNGRQTLRIDGVVARGWLSVTVTLVPDRWLVAV